VTWNPAFASSEASMPVPVPTSRAVGAGRRAHRWCSHGSDKIDSFGPGGPGVGSVGGPCGVDVIGNAGGVCPGLGAQRSVWRSRSTAFRYIRVMERASIRSYTAAIIENRC